MSRLPFRIIVHLALILERAIFFFWLCISCSFLSTLSPRIVHFACIYGVPDKLREFVGCCFAGAFLPPHHALRAHS